MAAMQKGVSNKAVEAKTNDNPCKVSKIQQQKVVKHVFLLFLSTNPDSHPDLA